jgi:hypothetical protein
VKENIVLEKAYKFALLIVELYRNWILGIVNCFAANNGFAAKQLTIPNIQWPMRGDVVR